MKKIGRKLYHLGGGLGLVALYAWFGRTPGLAFILGLALFATALDLIRLKNLSVNRFFFKYFPKFIRDSEKDKLTGTPWYLMGVLLSLALFSFPVAVYAVSFLACGDVAATTVGERWGTIKISGVKSLQGTVAFFIAASIAGFVINFCCFPMSPAIFLTGALVASIIEIIPMPVNDNLSIPLAAGAVMQILA